MQRLSAATLSQLPGHVRRPAYDRNALEDQVVHIGVGAFHRGHQAIYTEIANEIGGSRAGVTGLSLRSPTSEKALGPQDGYYTLGVRNGSDEELRLIGNIREVITAPTAPHRAIAALIRPSVSVVTLTITEKGYGLDPSTGTIVTDHGDVASDLANTASPSSAIGYLVEALRQRHETDAGPLTIISCDNLPHNGSRLRSAVLQFADHTHKGLKSWIDTICSFPETMVDRIVPATRADDIQSTDKKLNLRDEGFIKTEPFMQWVIEDKFAGPRPAWDQAGAMLVRDVAAFETAKLRLLNGSHSAIAYLGYLSGHKYVHDVMKDDALSPFITKLMDDAIAPTVPEPEGMAIVPYARSLRERFQNSALQHETWQIAMDGSQKLPQRLLNTVRDRLTIGQPIDLLALPIAAWIRYAAGADENGHSIDVRDPLADQFNHISQLANGNAKSLMDGFLGITEVFGKDLPRHKIFTSSVETHLISLMTKGSLQTVRELL